MTRRHPPGLAPLALAALGVLGAPAARGAPGTATVICSVAATGVAFGIYDPFGPSPAASTGTVTLSCSQIGTGETKGSATISLSTGSSGSYAARTLLAGAGTLQYNLYLDAAYAQVWGDGSNGSGTLIAPYHVTPGNPGQPIVSTIYGLIATGQDVDAGSYLDTIIVTVTY